VTNNGLSAISGATVTNNIPTQIVSWDWTCVELNGASGCSPINGSVANFTDDVNLPVGASIIYTVDADIDPAPTGDLVNTATVAVPAGYVDSDGSNNARTDIDILIVPVVPPPADIQINNPPDGTTYTLTPAGSTLTLNFTTEVNGDVGSWDLIYYEYYVSDIYAPAPPPAVPGIWLDCVIIEIGDGQNWYEVFNWCDNNSDTNTNVAHVLLPPDPPYPPPEEPDERAIPSTVLYGTLPLKTGVAIDLDIAGIPAGSYPYLRITAPVDNNDNQLEIDALVAITP